MPRVPFTDGWSYRRPLGPFAAAQPGTDTPVPVRLPHDALRDVERTPDAPAKGGSAYYPHAAFTYLKTFDAPAEWAGRIVRLEIQGAHRHAMVFLNDELVGNRADGFTRFFVDLTPVLRVGAPNELRIEVRSGEDTRWYAGSGLHRPVILHVDEPVHVVPDGVRVTTLRLEADQAVVEVATTVTNRGVSSVTTRLSTTLSALAGVGEADDAVQELETASVPVTVRPGEDAVVRQVFYVAEPRLWSVEAPFLHTAVVTLGAADGAVAAATADPATAVFGIRTVTVDPRKGLRINGEEVLLRGACIHSDNGPLGTASIARAEERKVELLKAAGFNAIRSAHNPASPAFLDAADRLGLLVMDESFDMWVRGKTPYDYALDFPQWWERDIEAQVAKVYNHPSVIFYSIGNEIVEVGTPQGSVWARRLAEKVRSLDPTRLVTNGVNAALTILDELAELTASDQGLNEMMADAGEGMMSILGSSDAVTRRTEESSSVLDVLGLNYADGRYELDRELFPNRVIVGSETFPSQIGMLWPKVLANPNVIGDFTWTGFDYLGEVGIGATAYASDPTAVAALEREFPYLTAWCGDLDITGRPRPVSLYRQVVFGLRAEPGIAVLRPEHHGHEVTMQSPWAWSDSVSSWTWPGHEGSPVTVEVYADADEVSLLVDDVEVARGPVGTARPMLATLETVYTPGTLTAVAWRAGTETARSTLRSASADVRLAVTADRDALRADDTDLAYVTVELRDPSGVLVTGADRAVSVEVGGAGELAAFGTGTPSTTERFDATTRTTFDGAALAVVRPTGAGTITVVFSAEGLEPVTVEVTAR